MPSGYAHFRFGKEALSLVSKDTERLVQRFRPLYNVGLQGPDFLFYFNPLKANDMGRLASRFHMQSGREFFGNALSSLRQAPSEEGKAYLYGVLGHYCLDSVCHPFIKATAAVGRIGHTELETEFDRYLLSADGLLPPHTQQMIPHFRLTKQECITAARFYPNVTPAVLRQCLLHMRLANRLLTAKNRKLVTSLMSFGGDVGRQMVMTSTANENCAHLDDKMLALYTQALEKYPRLSKQLEAAMNGGELGDDFAACFG